MPIKIVSTPRVRGRGRGRGGGTARGRGGGRGGSTTVSSSTTPASGAETAATQATAFVSRDTARSTASATPAPASAPSTRTRLSTAPAAGAKGGPLNIMLNFSLTRAGSEIGRNPSNTVKAGPKKLATLVENDKIDAEHDSEDEIPAGGLHTVGQKCQQEGEGSTQRKCSATLWGDRTHMLTTIPAPDVQVLQVTSNKRGRSPKIVPETIPEEAQDNQVSSSSVCKSHISQPSPDLQVDPKVSKILDHLKSSSEVLIELPELYDECDPDKVRPYTGTQLMHIYLKAHRLQLVDICDLVIDTWIRAFHAQRSRDVRADPSNGLWRRNSVLKKRRARFEGAHHQAGLEYDEPVEFGWNAPVYKLSAEDPTLDRDVISFDSTLLGELYAHTPVNCGARRLWSDAMVLAGDKATRMFVDTARHGFVWPQGFKDDVMKTSLRILRRKVTLKIEESSEGAWCKRYHGHGAERVCYRAAAAAVAAARVKATEDENRKRKGKEVGKEINAGWSSDEDSDEDSDGMEEALRRGLEEDEDEDEDDDKDDGWRASKRQRME
ncbi:hypothetical protein J1614_006921 [Plenodomus biglobosus]|nr:hypothetical protein J1614_006921 [Plenodomus biglobosus]